MKIERISDNQVRVILNKSDLSEREIKISELAYGSEKAQKLFKDMMKRAFDEYGFDADNAPLMIEAVPLSTESIMIIVTKVDEPEELDEKLANLTPNKNIRKFKKKSSSEDEEDTEVIDLPNNNKLDTKIYLYMFKQLDDILDAAIHITPNNIGSSLFKNPRNKKMYLLIKCKHKIPYSMERILLEYGEKVNTSLITEGYLNEHTEMFINNDAIEKLKLI